MDALIQIMSQFGSLKITELQRLLKERGLKVSGRKAELVQRLDFFENNKENSHSSTISVSENLNTYKSFITPEKYLYKDVNSDTSLPVFTLHSFNAYAACFSKFDTNCFINDYKKRFLYCFRSFFDGTFYYLYGEARSSMKATLYPVDIILNDQGLIVDTQCECTSGAGLNTFCSHRCLLLLAICDHSSGNEILTFETCTSKPQKWGRPLKPFKGSPKKSNKLVNRTFLEATPVKKSSNYSTFLKNHASGGIRQTNKKRPISHLIDLQRNACKKSVALDHNYSKEPSHEMFLLQRGLREVDDSFIEVSHNSKLVYCT